MKRTIFGIASVLLGTIAYIGIGMALWNAG